MEGTRTSLWLFLLLSLTNADQSPFTEQPDSHQTNSRGVSWAMTSGPDPDANATRVDCLIDTEMGLIAVGSAGGLIVCLLVTTVVLACQIHVIQRRAHTPRTSRSNMDLVSGTGYWDAIDRSEAAGLVGPCDASVMLEEVRADGDLQAGGGAEGWEVEPEAGPAGHEDQPAMQSCRDSCLEIPRDLEDMPLVV